MIIKILSFSETVNNQKIRVYFSSEVGNAIGEWVDDDNPVVNQVYDVELAFGENLIWSNNVVAVDDQIEQIMISADEWIILFGEVEILDKDDCTIKLAGSFIPCSIEGSPNSVKTFVRVRVRGLLIYDTHIL